MEHNMTREFKGAEEKGLNVLYNDTTSEFEIEYRGELAESFYDSPVSEDNGTSDGTAREAVQNYINEF